ncbi:DUF4147 domain-containing protein [Metallosphaera tengchongensis]|uniref:DUF4147 domain-containing protein n=1 Tax=Metallosphaera tengchongensis TaxID=1532350 RepID=A0A6N0NUZ6_9CREN|nr:glycerate 2-kinase [Metallosphaera tengchongensis]QKQ99662.1 DUF4147 domain-containing protein [Metallosphaera tengchongensis]
MEELVEKILELADPERALERKVRLKEDKVEVQGFQHSFKKPLVVSVGKASVKMANFFLKRLNDYQAIVVRPKGNQEPVHGNCEIIEAGHPNPDRDSIRAGKRVVELLTEESYDVVFFLLSGGASALMEDPIPPLEEYMEINDRLVKSGLSIQEINIVRKHLSRVKGGRLAQLSKAPIVTFVVSDVPGDDLSTIGSGPTVPDNSSMEEANQILQEIGIKTRYLSETPKSLNNSYALVVLDVAEVLNGISSFVPNPVILSSEVRGDARSLGAFMASILNTRDIPFSRPFTILMGGEPEVRIEGKPRKGGRNGEVCLSFLEWVKKQRFKLIALATDGIDGNSEYAGCVLDESITIPRKEIRTALREHSSYELLERFEAIIKTGPTGTNVNNVYVLMAP